MCKKKQKNNNKIFFFGLNEKKLNYDIYKMCYFSVHHCTYKQRFQGKIKVTELSVCNLQNIF